MSAGNQPVPCPRPGCNFDRGYYTHEDGSYRRRRNCSAACRVWLGRAHGALKHGNGEEAAELLRLAEKLDARQTPRDPVPEVFTQRTDVA